MMEMGQHTLLYFFPSCPFTKHLGKIPLKRLLDPHSRWGRVFHTAITTSIHFFSSPFCENLQTNSPVKSVGWEDPTQCENQPIRDLSSLHLHELDGLSTIFTGLNAPFLLRRPLKTNISASMDLTAMAQHSPTLAPETYITNIDEIQSWFCLLWDEKQWISPPHTLSSPFCFPPFFLLIWMNDGQGNSPELPVVHTSKCIGLALEYYCIYLLEKIY